MQREGHTAGGPAPAADTGGPGRHDVLNLYLSDTRQLFNSMDPAPFRERNLDPEAAAYIVQWAEEVPAGQTLGMVVHLGSGPVAATEVSVVRDSVRDYFQRRLASIVSRERYAALIEHSLVIGAWVALWRPLEIFLYDWWPVRAEARLYDRLGAMDVRLVETSVPPGPGGGGAT